MRIHFSWIFFLIFPYPSVTSIPVQYYTDDHLKQISTISGASRQVEAPQNVPKHESTFKGEKVISVRITSSFAVDKGRGKPPNEVLENRSRQLQNDVENYNPSTTNIGDVIITTEGTDSSTILSTASDVENNTDIPPTLEGANMEYIKQLQAKKGERGMNRFDKSHTLLLDNSHSDDYQNEPLLKSSVHDDKREENLDEDVPLARSVPLSYSSKRYFQDSTHRPPGSFKFTTVNFNVVHDTVKENISADRSNFANFNHGSEKLQTFYNEPAKVYSQPAKVYSEPSKFYSEPAKIYSEPAKIYSEPSRVYSEPAKVYSEPAKFYSQPASLNLNLQIPQHQSPWTEISDTTRFYNSINTTPTTFLSTTPQFGRSSAISEHLPEKNYEVDEKDSVMSNGQSHGVQQATAENCKQENCKVGYVVEGRQFRKYRVEERTSDGFIVGEYGVVRNEDGALRGVRYTADSEASPRLIHDALMKFLQLK